MKIWLGFQNAYTSGLKSINNKKVNFTVLTILNTFITAQIM